MPMEASGWLVGTGILIESILVNKKLLRKNDLLNVKNATLHLLKIIL